MLDKKLTRKQFLLSIASIAGLFVMSKVPSIIKNSKSLTSSNKDNTYGKYSYGGSKQNA